MIGVDVISFRVMSLGRIRNLEMIEEGQARYRKWIMLFTAICSLAMKIFFVIIYQGELWDLKDI